MHSKLALELGQGLAFKGKLWCVHPAFTEDRGHKAGDRLSWERAQISDMKTSVSCPIHLPTPPHPPISVLLLFGYHTGKDSDDVKTLATVSWENHLGGMLHFQSPKLPGSPSVPERGGAGSDGINSFRDL